MLPWNTMCGIYLASACIYLVCLPKLPVGWLRLCASLPLLVCAAILPFSIGKITARGSIAFVATWLTLFKVLAAAAGRGPLTGLSGFHSSATTSATSHNTNSHSSSSGVKNKSKSLLQCAALLLLPLTEEQHTGGVHHISHHSTPRRGQSASPAPHPLSAARLVLRHPLAEVCLKLAAGFSIVLLLHSTELPALVRHLMYAVIVWLSVSVVLDGPTALLGGYLGLDLAPSMSAPLTSTSLAHFWGRRYNRAVSAVLRFTVYEPLLHVLAPGSNCCCGGSSSSSSKTAPSTCSSKAGTQHSSSSTGGSNSGGCCCCRQVDTASRLDGSPADEQLLDDRCDTNSCQNVCALKGSSCKQASTMQQQQQQRGWCWAPWFLQPSLGCCCETRATCARAAATAAAFAVSGLMHELCVWHMCQVCPLTSPSGPVVFLPGRHLMFFLLQAPLVLLEKQLLGISSSGSSNGSTGSSSRSLGPDRSAALQADAPSDSRHTQTPHDMASIQQQDQQQPQQQQQSSTSSSSNKEPGGPAHQQPYARSQPGCTQPKDLSQQQRRQVSDQQQQRQQRGFLAALLPAPCLQVLRVSYTWGSLLLLAELFFWPPLESCGVDVHGIAELSQLVTAAAAACTNAVKAAFAFRPPM